MFGAKLIVFSIVLSVISAANLFIEIKYNGLNAAIQGIKPWIAAQLHRSHHLHDFHHRIICIMSLRTRIVNLELSDIMVSKVDMGDVSLKFDETDAYLEIMGISVSFVGKWKYDIHIIKDSGNVTVNISGANLSIWYLRPQAISGLPFIDANLNCSAKIDQLNIEFGGNNLRVYNVAANLVEKFFRKQTENSLCHETVRALDRFLKDKLKQLNLRTRIYGAKVLDYSVLPDPYFHNTSLITTHVGQISYFPRSPLAFYPALNSHDWTVTYTIRPDLINQVASSLSQLHAFDANLTLPSRPGERLEIKLTESPVVRIFDHSAAFKVTAVWCLHKARQQVFRQPVETVFNDVFSMETTFDSNAQLRFRLIAIEIETETETDGSKRDVGPDVNVRKLYHHLVFEHFSTTVASFLLLPLPNFANLSIAQGQVSFSNGFVVFGADMM